MDKFRHKLPKDELKRLGKEIAKKLVASDYKNKRVGDPTAALSEKQSLKIKKYVKDFLARAVEKYDVHQKKQLSKNEQSGNDNTHNSGNADSGLNSPKDVCDVADDIALSDVEEDESPDALERKRKRDVEIIDSAGATPSDGPDPKRQRGEESIEPNPPPPPPPPPEAAADQPLTEEQVAEREAHRKQEEDLMRENEEAQRFRRRRKQNQTI